ncbi:MAG: tRNA pseudouridine(38-40) synthase TruA, partial [Myxococcales bacterium]|nr:tRNA pseudouridine(38-40) synthase TruA [Myxococcales bacterium]
RGLNRHLPGSIAVRFAARVPFGFHPRFEARGKRYRYLLLCDPVRDPLFDQRAWRLHDLTPDGCLAALNHELAAAVGRHDFSAFASARDRREHRDRHLTEACASRLPGTDLVAIDIAGDHFLHNMVRILVGTAVDVARRRRPAGTLARALASKDRRNAGMTAPPEGLYLEALSLSHEGEDRWPPSPAESAG